jgi:hypothetical protein
MIQRLQLGRVNSNGAIGNSLIQIKSCLLRAWLHTHNRKSLYLQVCPIQHLATTKAIA